MESGCLVVSGGVRWSASGPIANHDLLGAEVWANKEMSLCKVCLFLKQECLLELKISKPFLSPVVAPEHGPSWCPLSETLTTPGRSTPSPPSS